MSASHLGLCCFQQAASIFTWSSYLVCMAYSHSDNCGCHNKATALGVPGQQDFSTPQRHQGTRLCHLLKPGDLKGRLSPKCWVGPASTAWTQERSWLWHYVLCKSHMHLFECIKIYYFKVDNRLKPQSLERGVIKGYGHTLGLRQEESTGSPVWTNQRFGSPCLKWKIIKDWQWSSVGRPWVPFAVLERKRVLFNHYWGRGRKMFKGCKSAEWEWALKHSHLDQTFVSLEQDREKAEEIILTSFKRWPQEHSLPFIFVVFYTVWNFLQWAFIICINKNMSLISSTDLKVLSNPCPPALHTVWFSAWGLL